MDSDRIPEKSTVESPSRFSIQYEDYAGENELIGRGGQAAVYEVQLGDEYPIDRIALKEPLDPDTLTRNFINSFLEEAKTWETVDQREREKSRWDTSEHIVGVIDTGDQLPWIAMEYMDGGSLKDRLNSANEGLPTEEALWIAECLCHGIEVAHSNGIAHLDLKPANVLFRETEGDNWEVAKIGDWGVARVLADETGTVENLSVSYAAPEQFAPDEFGEPDTLTDIHQLGAVLYTMITGIPPYSGSQLSVMHDVTTTELPPPPSDVRPGLSDAVDATVLTALETEKTERYDSVHGFKRAIQAVRRNERLPWIVDRRIENDTKPAEDKQQISDGLKRSESNEESRDLTKKSRSDDRSSTTADSDIDDGNDHGQASTGVPNTANQLSDGDVIKLAYTARTASGGQLVDTTDTTVAKEANVSVADQSTGSRIIVLGDQYLFESVEEDIIGKSVGDTGEVTIPAEQAWGERDPDNIRMVDVEKISESDPERGSTVEIDGEEGVLETAVGGRARVDFNHPLAGKDIKYTYEIVEYVGRKSELDLQYERRVAEAVDTHIPELDTGIQEEFFELEPTDSVPFVKTAGPLRIPVEDVFSISDLGTVLHGTVATGTVSTGEEVVVQPSDISGTVERIEMYHQGVSKAEPGDNIHIAIEGIDKSDARRGDVIGATDDPPTVADSFKAQIVVTDHPSVITAGYTPVFHAHTAQTACTIESIDQELVPSTGEVSEFDPDYIQSGDSAVVSVRPKKPLSVEAVSEIPELGTFTMRDMGQTIGIGKVVDITQD